jgi:hypothetical protein
MKYVITFVDGKSQTIECKKIEYPKEGGSYLMLNDDDNIIACINFKEIKSIVKHDKLL